jgi:hypothetical protein
MPKKKAELRSYEPSWRERLGYAASDALKTLGLGKYRSEALGRKASGAADFIPGVGGALTADDIKRSYQAGDRLGLGVNLAAAGLGAVPVIGGAGAKAVKGLGREVAKKVAGKAAKKGRAEAITAVSLRDKPLPEAIEYVKAGKHIKPKEGGGYVGAPRWVKNEKDLQKMRDEFDALVSGGTEGADWYDRTQSWIKRVAGDDKDAQAILADDLALFSAQADPDANLGFALQARNAKLAGQPMDVVRTGQQARTFNKGRDTGKRIKLGKKTGIFGMHMDPTRVNPTTGTNDIWHARALGYKTKDEKDWKSGLTPQQHAWMDAETVLAVARANDKKLGGRGDWTPGEIQAAPWVAGKAKGLEKKRKLSPEAALVEAGKTYPDFEQKYVVNATHEQTPGAPGHLAGLQDAPPELRAAYSADPRASWMGLGGRDVLKSSQGMLTAPTVPMQGLYNGMFNPGQVARGLGAMQGPTGSRVMQDQTRKLMDASEGFRGYMDAQDAAAYSMPIPSQKMSHSNAYEVKLPEGMTPQDAMISMQGLGGAFDMPDIVHYGGDRAVLTNFGKPKPEEIMPLPTTGDAARYGPAGGIGRQQAKIAKESLGGLGAPVRLESAYLPSGFTEQQGTDAATKQMLERVQGLEEGLDTPEVRAKVLGKMQLDDEMAVKTGTPVRADIQLARKLFHEGGFKALREALGQGLLPAATVGIFYGYATDDSA